MVSVIRGSSGLPALSQGSVTWRSAGHGVWGCRGQGQVYVPELDLSRSWWGRGRLGLPGEALSGRGREAGIPARGRDRAEILAWVGGKYRMRGAISTSRGEYRTGGGVSHSVTQGLTGGLGGPRWRWAGGWDAEK